MPRSGPSGWRGGCASRSRGSRSPSDRVVDLLRAVDRRAVALEALEPALRQRELPGGCEGARVRDRPAARERAGAVRRVADELGRPPHGLVLDLGGGARVDREVDVVGVREQVGDRADLQPARADEREVARPRLRDHCPERPGRRRRAPRGPRPAPAATRPASADRTRSSSAGSSGRNRSNERQASVTSLTACSSASSRGASKRSGRWDRSRLDGTRGEQRSGALHALPGVGVQLVVGPEVLREAEDLERLRGREDRRGSRRPRPV